MKKIVLMAMFAIVGMMFAFCSTGGAYFARTYTEEIDGIQSIQVDVRDRKIVVAPSNDHAVHISCFESEKEHYSLTNDGNVLKLEYVQNKSWFDFIGTKPKDEMRVIMISLPADRLDDLSLSTTNEDIILNNITVLKNLYVSNTNGNIALDNIDAGASIALVNKNGEIYGSIVGGYDDYSISVSIKKGDSNLASKDGGTKSLVVSNNNGNIDLTLNK